MAAIVEEVDISLENVEAEFEKLQLEQEEAAANLSVSHKGATLDTLTDKQLEALCIMRMEFADADGCGMPMNDVTFLRYLRARNYDTKKSILMLKATIEWRHSFGLANMNTTWRDQIISENAFGKMYARGFDKEGHVLLYMKPVSSTGKVDMEAAMRHLVYNMERAIAIMDARTNQEKIALVMDYNGYSLSNAPPFKIAKDTMNILQNHYPERLHRAYVIRPPSVFSVFWRMISPFIDSVTKQKIAMLPNKVMNKPDNQLHKDIERNILEPCADGLDLRPFDSNLYMSNSFDLDYQTIIDNVISANTDGNLKG